MPKHSSSDDGKKKKSKSNGHMHVEVDGKMDVVNRSLGQLIAFIEGKRLIVS